MSSAGKTKIIVDTGALGDGDSIAAYLVDAAGTLLTSTLVGGAQSLDVNVTASVLPTGAATEATLATLATEATLASILAELAQITFAEDTAHTTGDFGTMPLAVRNDAGTALAGTDGDYIPLSTDATGNLRTTFSGTVTVAGSLAEDAVHSSGAAGFFSLTVRNDNQATTFTSATGDYAPIATDKKGAIYTKSAHNISNLQQVIAVGTSAVALPTAPLADRTSMFVQMLSSGQLYLGSATVTNAGATRGLQLGNGGFVSLEVGPSNLVYGIANAAAKDVAVWEFV